MEVNSAAKSRSKPDAGHKFFRHEDPIGRLVKINMLENFPDSPVKDPVFEIIGVIRCQESGLRDPAMPEVLAPFTITARSTVPFWSGPQFRRCDANNTSWRFGPWTATSLLASPQLAGYDAIHVRRATLQ